MWCPDWFQEPVWEAVWDCFPDTFPDTFPGGVWEGVWEAAPDSFPDPSQTPIPGGVWEGGLGRPGAGSWETCSRTSQTAPGRPNHLFLGIGGLGGSGTAQVVLGVQFLIVYILVSSKPALQNPVTLGFGQGSAKTARETANSGQFSATFYGLFPTPHFFTKFVLWSVLEHGFPGILGNLEK